MLRLAFLLLVMIGALAVIVSLAVAIGLYQAARLQEPATETTPTAAVQQPATRQATPPRVPGSMLAGADADPTLAGRPPEAKVEQDGANDAGDAPAVPLDPARPVVLLAKDAVLIGDDVRLDEEGEPTLVNWRKRTDGVEWTAQAPATGIYDVEINYACNRQDGGGVLSMRAGPGGITTSLRPTGGWNDFQDQYIGKLYLTKGGNAIYLRPVYLLPDGRLVNLRSVKLTFLKPMTEGEFDKASRRRRTP